MYSEEKSRIRFMSLGDHIIEQVTVVPCIQRSSRGNPTCSQENSNTKENIIIIDDEELITEHKKSVSTARKMDALIRKCLNFNSTFNSFTKYGMNVKKSQRKKRKALMEYAKQLNDEFEREIQADPSAVTEKENKSKESFSFAPEIESSCEVGLQEAAIHPSVLRQTWGENYQEGHCFPRKFAIDLSGLIKCSSVNFDLAVMVLLFELKHEKEHASKICKASVKLVLHNEIAELNTSHKLNEQIKTEFIDTVSENCSNVFSVSNIVDVGLKCIKKYEILQREKPLNVSSLGARKPFCTTDVFEDVLGWRGKSCTEKEALAMLKKEVNRGNQEIDPQISCASSTPAAECGICFEGDQTHTTLISCGHSFCNSCWEFYIKTVLNLGETNLFCPAHQCQTQIDNIVIMSLATSWYGKYISWKIKRNLSKSSMLKHCPSEGCDLVVQVKPCDKNSRKLISDPLPVVCACGQTWCFQCQEPAHWPSHCDKAQQFRAEYKEYARKIKRDQVKKEITSVMVKKCPNCKYPIEKFHGCDHMHCGLCGVHFCWRCLSCKLAEDHNYYDCKFRSVASSEILLPRVNKSRTQTLVDIALSNCLARRASNMLGLQRKLKSMEQGLQAYGFLKKNVLKKSKTSRITSVLEGMVQLNTLQLVKDAFNFKLQAHVVLEGLAIILIKGAKDNSYQNDLLRLLFIVEGLDKLLSNPCSLCNEQVVRKVTVLVERGKMCVVGIKRHVKYE